MRNAEEDLKVCNAATPGPWFNDGGQIVNKAHNWLCQFWSKSEEDFKNADNNATFVVLACDALPYWIKRVQELEKVLCGYEQWEADLLMDDQAWSSGLPCFTQGLYDKWMELQEQRNKALRKEKSENDSAKR